MKAYAVSSGGGVKCAALAGAIAAAQKQGIEFVGYGGTSGGSIVSLLAAVGYREDQLHEEAVERLDFSSLLSDGGAALDAAKSALQLLASGKFFRLMSSGKAKAIINTVSRQFGLYDSARLAKYLRERVVAKIPNLASHPEISFEALEDNGAPQLKILATDLTRRCAAVFSREANYSQSVVDAVVASAAFPFVFRPIEKLQYRLIDGGLSSNLPVFWFAEEHRRSRYPILAFDLVPGVRSAASPYNVRDLFADLIGTGLEASDALLRDTLSTFSRNIVYVPIETPEINAMDLGIDRGRREELFNCGFRAATGRLSEFPALKLRGEAGDNLVRQIQLNYGPPKFYQPLLAAVAHEIEQTTNAQSVRAHVMLNTGSRRGSRVVVYHYGMDGDPDRELELERKGGCTGAALESEKGIAIADMNAAKKEFEEWNMTQQQQTLVRQDRQALISVAIPGWLNFDDLTTGPIKDRIGTLSVDTSTRLQETRWIENGKAARDIVRRLQHWALVIARLLP